jgi:hypothetical protein
VPTSLGIPYIGSRNKSRSKIKVFFIESLIRPQNDSNEIFIHQFSGDPVNIKPPIFEQNIAERNNHQVMIFTDLNKIHRLIAKQNINISTYNDLIRNRLAPLSCKGIYYSESELPSSLTCILARTSTNKRCQPIQYHVYSVKNNLEDVHEKPFSIFPLVQCVPERHFLSKGYRS